MKVVAIMVTCGCLQAMINGFCELWQPPFSYKAKKEVPVDSKWECSHCGHNNENWTSICGRCGWYRSS